MGSSASGPDPFGLFPDNSFRVGGLKNKSILGPEQESLLGPLSDWIKTQFTTGQPELDGLTTQLNRDTSDESRVMAGTIFSKALLGPAMEAFNQTVAPQIAGDFANVGGTLSSRRGQALAAGRVGVVRQAESGLAGLLPQIEAFPLQQTLAQIQGRGAIQQQRFAPYQNALQFALTPTRQNLDESPGPAWGVLSNFAGAI